MEAADSRLMAQPCSDFAHGASPRPNPQASLFSVADSRLGALGAARGEDALSGRLMCASSRGARQSNTRTGFVFGGQVSIEIE